MQVTGGESELASLQRISEAWNLNGSMGPRQEILSYLREERSTVLNWDLGKLDSWGGKNVIHIGGWQAGTHRVLLVKRDSLCSLDGFKRE